MSSSAEAGRGALRAGPIWLALVFALALAAGWAAGAAAQDVQDAVPNEWDATVERGVELVSDPQAFTPELELLRDRLLRMRSSAIENEASAAARLADVNARLTSLGPPPAEGAEETREIAERRKQIAVDLSVAQAPVLEAQDFQRRADALIREIDQVVRARFAAELRSLGPSPLRPIFWFDAIGAVVENLRAHRQAASASLADPVARALIVARVPLDVLLALVGIAIAFGLRIRLVGWVEGALARATTPRSIALLVNLRNFIRLIVPAVGAGLLLAALDPAKLTDPTAESALFALPGFAIAVIAAGWLGASLFAPKLPSYRLAPLECADAATGARLAMGLGLVVGAHLFIRSALAEWSLSPAEAAVLAFPLFVIGGLLLWRTSRLMRVVRRQIIDGSRGVRAGERTGAIMLTTMKVAERGAWTIAIAAPMLAAIGFLAAASFLLYGAILTLGLFGAGIVLYDLATTTLGAVADRQHEADGPNGGLIPVLVAALLMVASLPALALIWGARPSDVAGIWFLMRDGVTFGGMRISIGMIVSFTVVFGLIYGIFRLLQTVLRSTVLPRTRLDAGGRNAVLAGVGYTGFFVAAIAAVSSTGIDLSSLAFVAGALSVGIGFGLQNIVSNFVSGIILLVERPIKEGDWIEVGGFAGYVRSISVRSTEVETFDRASVIVPNSDLVAGTVLNRTHAGLSGRLQVPVGVEFEADPRRVEALLLEIAEAYPLVLTDPSPRVLLLELGPDALLFEIRCWLRDVNFLLSAKSDMNFAILKRFAEEGIRMQPYLRELRLPPNPPPVDGSPTVEAKQS